MLSPRSTAPTCLLICLISTAVFAQGPPVPLADRARGSERVVVGRVTSVSPVWQTNQFGDRLIVSIVSVAVDETLRGPVQQAVDVEIEGGTIGELTLHVSDLESFAPGDRGIFFLRRGARAFVPHLRAQGLLKLDRSDRVRGSDLTLADVRRAAGQAR
jgi:hypothetical protein